LYLEIGLKPAVFGYPDYAKELFKSSKDLASLLVGNENKFFLLGFADFL